MEEKWRSSLIGHLGHTLVCFPSFDGARESCRKLDAGCSHVDIGRQLL